LFYIRQDYSFAECWLIKKIYLHNMIHCQRNLHYNYIEKNQADCYTWHYRRSYGYSNCIRSSL